MTEAETQGLSLAGVVLAAGASARLGQPKQLLPHTHAGTFVEHAVGLAGPYCDLGITVVAGAQYEPMRELLAAAAVEVVANPRWQSGMGGSLRTGLTAVPADASAVLLLLCDQPLLEPADIATLIDVWQNHPLQPVAATYSDVVGAPAVIPASRLPALMATLGGDSGAGKWLRNCSDAVGVALPNAAFDVDTPADLKQFIKTTDKG